MKHAVTVLIVDDSSVVRQVFRNILEAEEGIRVIATANDPFEAVKRISIAVPDVMIVDVEMPGMDGITFLRKVMGQHPIPTIVCSTLSGHDSVVAFEATRAGAVMVLEKPRQLSGAQEFGPRLREAVRLAATARVRVPLRDRAGTNLQAKHPPVNPSRPIQASVRRPAVIAIGASTGGTEAIRRVLTALPPTLPPIVIAQHMPMGFTASFAGWLDACCSLSVTEATNGQTIGQGQAVVAKGGHHLRVRYLQGKVVTYLSNDEPINRHRPSVDALFDSVSTELGALAHGILLTGMGDDGARGLLRLRQSGARTIAESEESAVVFGMPKEAIARGAAEMVFDLDAISAFLTAAASGEAI